MGGYFSKKDQTNQLSENENDTFKKNDQLRILDSIFPESTKYRNAFTLYRLKIPYLIEDYLGFDRRYEIGRHVPGNLITYPERKCIKDADIDGLKKLFYKGQVAIDDPIDPYSKHAMIHDAVVMNRVELFDFLLAQKANLMVRDVNGYTPMLKAAALGRTDMVKRMIEEGVDPRHIDPWGNTPRDKAKLYNRYELMEYLEEMEQKAARGEIKKVDWKSPDRLRRTGRFITIFDY